jgi:opacity protein-like surface antigen
MSQAQWLLTFAGCALLGLAPLQAQDNAGLTQGKSEVTGFVGIADGEGTLGGSYGKAISDKLFAQGEFSYIALGSSSTVTPGGTYDVSASAINFNGGVQYNFTNLFTNNSKIVPYAGAGLGVTRSSVSADLPGFSSSASDTAFLLNFGGGLRYYLRPNWGLRPEFMIFAGDGSYARFSVGLFYQF